MLAALLVPAAAFTLGGVTGLAVRESPLGRRLAWARLVRGQLLLSSVLLSLLSAWRLDSVSGLAAPAALQIAPLAVLAVALASRGHMSVGEATLEAWTTDPNISFWVLPLAAAIAGAEGVVLIALADRMGAFRVTLSMHLLRRSAPKAQKRSTVLVDHAPSISLAAGLLLSQTIAAPDWSALVLKGAGPVLAGTGAFLYVASLGRDHRDEGGLLEASKGGTLRRWLGLVVVRIASVLAVAIAFDEPLLWVLAPLIALSAPAFNPPQLARMYGYDIGLVRRGDVAGWVLAPIGLVLSIVATSRYLPW